MKYEKLVNGILSNIGGSKNIKGLTHCATRLRFQIKDRQKVNLEELGNLEGAIDAIEGQDEIQIIIGPDVPFVYKEVMAEAKLDQNQSDDTSEDTEKLSIGKRILGFISGTFTPLIPAIVGCGMLKAIVLILGNFNLISTESGSYAVLSAAGNAVFYFLPVFIGFTAAKKLGANPYVGATIGATLLEPTFTALFTNKADVDFFGIPMYLVDYSATIIPIFCAIAIYYFIDKWLTKVVHKNLQAVFVPTISLLVVVPLTILVFGPFGVTAGNLLTDFFSWMNATNSILLGAVYGGYLVFGVMFGLGWAVVPIMLQNLATNGGDPLMAAGAATNFVMFGIAFGFYLKSKDKNVKSVGLSTTITGLLAGISEPILYGLILKYNRTLPMAVIGGAIGGAFMGLFKVQGVAFAFSNIFTVVNFAPFVPYVIGSILSFCLGTGMVLIFGYEKSEKTVSEEQEEIETNSTLIED